MALFKLEPAVRWRRSRIATQILQSIVPYIHDAFWHNSFGFLSFPTEAENVTPAEEEFVAWLFAAVKPPAPKMVTEGCGRAARVLVKDLSRVTPLVSSNFV